MGSPAPERTADIFVEKFNSGDAAGFAALYTDGAVFTYDGLEKAVGRKQIEGAIAGFIMAGLKFKGVNVSVYVVGDVALTRFKWELSDASGAVISKGVSAEVQRRGDDGLWRFIIDDAGGGSRV